MEELSDIPGECIKPILRCLHLIKKGNILIYGTSKSFWNKYYRFLMYVWCVAYLIFITAYMGKAFYGELQVDELVNVVTIYAVTIQAILKAAIVVLNKKKIKAIILQLGCMWKTEELTEVQINKKNALLKRLHVSFSAFYWITVIVFWEFALAPFLETIFRKFILQQEFGQLLPFPCSFSFDPTGNWATYIGVYIFETNSVFLYLHFYLGMELLIVTLCSHIATEFTLLQEDLLNIKPGDVAPLKVVIANHQKLLRLSQQLDDVFNKAVFVSLFTASISICFFGFGVKVAVGIPQMAKNFAAVFAMTLPLYNLCYYGDRLKEASEGMAGSVYNSLWYDGDTRYQKLLWFIMIRSQKKCCLTSLKYKPITLNTFATVLSTTWSYFSLVSSVYGGEK